MQINHEELCVQAMGTFWAALRGAQPARRALLLSLSFTSSTAGLHVADPLLARRTPNAYLLAPLHDLQPGPRG